MTRQGSTPSASIGGAAAAGPRIGTWRRRTLVLIAAALALIALTTTALSGCTATVVPPAEVDEPRTVYLLDHGRTSSLVLPINDGMVRYAYGEHRWYALEQTFVLRAFPAMLWPTQGTLGRKRIDAPASASAVRRHVLVNIDYLHELRVEAEHVRELLDELHEHYAASAAEAGVISTPSRDLEFVRVAPSYHLLHNSNHVSADWLEALGCEVRGPRVLSRWRVRTASDG